MKRSKSPRPKSRPTPKEMASGPEESRLVSLRMPLSFFEATGKLNKRRARKGMSKLTQSHIIREGATKYLSSLMQKAKTTEE